MGKVGEMGSWNALGNYCNYCKVIIVICDDLKLEILLLDRKMSLLDRAVIQCQENTLCLGERLG